MLRKLALLILFAAPIPALANICPISNKVPSAGDGIGDGCSTQGIEWILPHVGIFKSTFTPACDKHDKCWTQLGANYDQCDSQFLSDMKNRCDSQFNQWLQPGENLSCKVTANEYKTAVEYYRNHIKPELMTNYQYEALQRSYGLQASVVANTCGTTSDRTTLYAPGFINIVNSAFQSAAGRLPTIYEFFEAVNQGDLVANPSGWQSLLYTRAANAASTIPPSVGWFKTMPGEYGVTFGATPVIPGASYYWKIPQISNSSSFTLSYPPPMFNRKITYAGFVKVTNSAGVRNMALVETSVTLPGTCAPNNGPWVNCN